MILYRYFGSHGYETLQNAELKVSLISSFNDPFEFMFRIEGKMTEEKAAAIINRQFADPIFVAQIQAAFPTANTPKKLKKLIESRFLTMVRDLVEKHPKFCQQQIADREALADKFIRIVSFSSSEAGPLDEILMWSHYANMHRGIRIGFEFPPDITHPFKVVPVEYRTERVAIDFSLDPRGDVMKEALRQSISVKSKAWSYEREYRLITLPTACVSRTVASQTFGFVGFDRKWVRVVDFGARCPSDEIARINQVISEHYPNIQVRQGSYHPSAYALTYSP